MHTSEIHLLFALEENRLFRGYPLAHLLAVHLKQTSTTEEVMKLFFSNELIVVRGTGLADMRDRLLQGSLGWDTEVPTKVTSIERRFYHDVEPS